MNFTAPVSVCELGLGPILVRAAKCAFSSTLMAQAWIRPFSWAQAQLVVQQAAAARLQGHCVQASPRHLLPRPVFI